MAENANLKTDITADNRQYMQAIAQAQTATMGFAKQIATVGTALKGAFALVGVGAVVSGFKNIYENIDKTIASANKLDISVRNFQALSFAAKRADVEIGTLENGLMKLRQAIAGSKPGDRIAGIEVEKLKTMDLSEAYAAVAESISGMGDQYKQAAAAKQAFGRAGQEQMNLVRGGRDAYNQYLDSNKGFSKADEETFNKLDKAADEAAETLKNTFQKALIGVAPVILGFVETVSKVKQAYDTGYNYAINDATNLMERAAPLNNDATKTTGRGDLRGGIGTFFSRQFGKGLGMLDDTFDKNPNKNVSLSEIGPALDASGSSLEKLAMSAAAASGALNKIGQSKLNGLFGIKDEESTAQDFISTNLAPVKQATSKEFNRLLAQARDVFGEGSTASSSTRATLLSQLKNEAKSLGGTTLDENGNYVTTSNRGALAAANQIAKGAEDLSTKPIQVNVTAKINKNGIIELFTEGGSGVGWIKDATKKMTADEAAALGS